MKFSYCKKSCRSFMQSSGRQRSKHRSEYESVNFWSLRRCCSEPYSGSAYAKSTEARQTAVKNKPNVSHRAFCPQKLVQYSSKVVSRFTHMGRREQEKRFPQIDVAVAYVPSHCESIQSTVDAQGPVNGPAKARFVPVASHFVKSWINDWVVDRRCSSRISSAPFEMEASSTT